MRKIICDRCGAEITGNRIGYVAVNWRATSDNSLMQDNPYEGADFCEKCMEDITRVIDFKILAAPEDEEPDPEEEETIERIQSTPARPTAPPDFGKIRELVKEAPQKKSVDKGKVGALSKAGWSNAKIADEMGVSSERIRQILKELEVKNG